MVEGTVVGAPPGPKVEEEVHLDIGATESLSWVTPRRVIIFVIAWLAVFSLGSIFISNPFASEKFATATPDYWHVMYLHAMLIGMVGLVSLVALEMFETCCTKHVRAGIVIGVVAATVIAGVGGLFDFTESPTEVGMWVQILSFAFLDEILILLMVGFWQGWHARLPSSRTIPFVAAWLASGSMLAAAIMGHLGGWILSFHDHPWIVDAWAKAAGNEGWQTLRDNLIGSHSHDMAVASMALIVSCAAYKLGYLKASGAARWISRLGMAMVSIGVIGMTILYVVMGFSAWAVPNYFNIAGDDLVTGVFVMLGGALALWPMIGTAFGRARNWAERSIPLAATAAYSGILVGVVLGGYWIERHESFFGGGDPTAHAAGAANDNVFLWIHQDIGLFLLPALVALMLVADRLASRRYSGLIGWTTLSAVGLLLFGGGIWVFVTPATHGAGYVLSTVGLVVLGVAIATTIYSGLKGDGEILKFTQRRNGSPGHVAAAPGMSKVKTG